MIPIRKQIYPIIDLFNGAKKGTMVSGEIKQISSIVVSSNFTPHNDQRLMLSLNKVCNPILFFLTQVCF